MWTVVNSRIQQAESFLGGFPCKYVVYINWYIYIILYNYIYTYSPIEWPVQTWITLYGGVKQGRDTGIIHAAPPTTLKLMTNPSVVGVWVKINEHASNYQLPGRVEDEIYPVSFLFFGSLPLRILCCIGADMIYCWSDRLLLRETHNCSNRCNAIHDDFRTLK